MASFPDDLEFDTRNCRRIAGAGAVVGSLVGVTLGAEDGTDVGSGFPYVIESDVSAVSCPKVTGIGPMSLMLTPGEPI